MGWETLIRKNNTFGLIKIIVGASLAVRGGGLGVCKEEKAIFWN